MKNNQAIKQTHPLITPDHLRRLAIIYVRQSTEEQVRDNVGSTEYQRGLVEVGRALGWEESQIQVIDEDLGKSGSSTERRKGLQRLQTLIVAKQVGIVIVATISRLSRQVLDFEIFRRMAAAHNTLLYTDGRLVDPADSHDTIVSQISAMVAHYENRQRADMMRKARKVRAQQGVVVSTLPVGWIKGPDSEYSLDPETKDTIRTIIDAFWRTRALRRTVIELKKAGVKIPARHGQRVTYKEPHIARVRKY
jgi:DNA invertase Pin-like site-specific DNA recombinase